MSYSKTIITGNMTRDPEMSYKGSDGSMAVTKFGVAVNGRKEGEVDFYNVVAFRGTAEFVNNYGRKGRKVLIEGRMKQNRWEDEDGNKHTAWELLASQVEFLDRRPVDDAEDDLDEPDF